MKLNRKNLTNWIEQHLRIGGCQDLHNKLCSVYVGMRNGEKQIVCAINKRKEISNFYRKTQREETGFNAGIWEQLRDAPHPVRLVICFEGEVYLHIAPDLRVTQPHVRPAPGTQVWQDDQGIAWWPLSDFENWTAGRPKYKSEDPAPQAPKQPNILDFFK